MGKQTQAKQCGNFISICYS